MFKCPVCGSEYFTTLHTEPDQPWIRQCRGRFLGMTPHEKHYSGCDFTWPSTHDNRYGLENGRDKQE